MRRGLAVAVLGLVLAAAGPAGAAPRIWLLGHHARTPIERTLLVSPSGQPVGGKWQRWVNEARIPTIRGRLIFTTDVTFCGGALGCSWGLLPRNGPSPYETAVTSGILARNTLYFELGHQFDWRVLTDKDRRHFAHLWHVPNARWWDSPRSLSRVTEDGLEGDFAAAYQACAWGNASIGGLTAGDAPTISPSSDTATCKAIARIGQRPM